MPSPCSLNALPLATLGFLAIWAWNGETDTEARSPVLGHPTRKYGTASWYSNASAKREGTCHVGKHGGCLTASGKELDDSKATAASWNYPLGTRLHIGFQGRSIIVETTDRGPAKRLYRQGRIIDLSRQAFQALAPLSEGIIQVTVEPVQP